ncbi:MAG: FAD-dependent thymidylate synthase [Chloroflexota bacterium]|nr:FAD-dependent thymidylate synthase [Chloroflexota bacterium]MDE2884244.1 FAD-dependent thymidylate synthase [Chloroflexota bacterium]
MSITPEQQAEIDALRSEQQETRRATVPALEDILYQALSVLDHGFVRVVDYMGDDAAIVQAARVSYGRGTKRTRDDQGLINYLMRNAHTSPFEMCEIKLHVKLPIFVARQWIRHRMANVNEYSARYSVLDREFYIPEGEQLAIQSATNNQGRGQVGAGEQLTLGPASAPQAASQPSRRRRTARERTVEAQRVRATQVETQRVQEAMANDAQRSFDQYDSLLSGGFARELARIGLPLSTYTQWYWKTDLHNLLHFLALRGDAHAQWEIQEYARVIMDIVERWVPLTANAFHRYRIGGARLSAEGLETVKRLLAGEEIDPAALEMSPREWRELKETLGLP